MCLEFLPREGSLRHGASRDGRYRAWQRRGLFEDVLEWKWHRHRSRHIVVRLLLQHHKVFSKQCPVMRIEPGSRKLAPRIVTQMELHVHVLKTSPPHEGHEGRATIVGGAKVIVHEVCGCRDSAGLTQQRSDPAGSNALHGHELSPPSSSPTSFPIPRTLPAG